jgi:hypothetical protein
MIKWEHDHDRLLIYLVYQLELIQKFLLSHTKSYKITKVFENENFRETKLRETLHAFTFRENEKKYFSFQP